MNTTDMYCEYYVMGGEERECDGTPVQFYDMEEPRTLHYNLVTYALCNKHIEADADDLVSDHDGDCPCHEDRDTPTRVNLVTCARCGTHYDATSQDTCECWEKENSLDYTDTTHADE